MFSTFWGPGAVLYTNAFNSRGIKNALCPVKSSSTVQIDIIDVSNVVSTVKSSRQKLVVHMGVRTVLREKVMEVSHEE